MIPKHSTAIVIALACLALYSSARAQTGFIATPASNTVTFNGVAASVTSATKTQLKVNVPAGATTGPIGVTTTNGTATSTGNFFISSESLYYNDRITFGESRIIPAGAANQSALLNFDGATGQRVSVVLEDLTVFLSSGSVTYANVTLLTPSGAALATTTIYNHADVPAGGAGTALAFGFLEPVTLPAPGSYAILIDWIAGWTSGVTARLYDVSPDIAVPIGTNGAPLPLAFSSPGQNARPTFTGAAGFRVSLRARQSVGTVIGTNLSILKPDNTSLATATFQGDRFIDPVTLTTNGVHSVLVDPLYNKTRDTTLYLYDVPADIAGSVSIGGPLLTVPIAAPGQNANLSLSVPSAQTVTIHATEHNIKDPVVNTGGLSAVTITLLNSGGGTVATTNTAVPNWSFTVSNLAAGAYTIKVDPVGGSAGSIKINVTSP